MKLLYLGSSDNRFQSIEFKDGLNIIVGEKVFKDDKKTSNGIGKSLVLICIDFLLGKGSQNKEIKKLKQVLKENEITLTLLFEHNSKTYKIGRNHKQIWVNDKEYESEKKFKEEFLNSLLDTQFTFRDIFSRFFRTNKESYQNAIFQVTLKENVYKNNLINAYLLGLDLEYLNKKRELKLKNDKLKSIIKDLSELKQEINKEKEYELIERIKKIEQDLKSFEIADNFNELKEKADLLSEEIRKLRNQLAYIQREVRNKKRVIKTNKQIDIDIELLSNMYEEVKFFLPDTTLKHIKAVKEFHETLFNNRIRRAKNEIEKLEKEEKIIKNEIEKLDKERSETLNYLNNKGALEEYHALVEEKENLQNELNEFESKEKLLKELKKEQADIKLEIDKFKRELIDLEEKLSLKIKKLGQMFREISEMHYEDHPGYLDISIVDDFRTDKLYNIEPEIKGDSSDGINEMKIFIYDMLIYKLNPELIGLAGHDNRLFDMVDERQIAKAFNYVQNNLKQYICSISDTKFEVAKENSDIDLDLYVRKRLSEKNKLFGFDFE